MIYPKFQKDIVNNKRPSWLDPMLLPEAPKQGNSSMIKTSSSKTEVFSYLCPECKKVYSRKEIESLEKDAAPQCPNCESKMTPYRSIGVPTRPEHEASYRVMLKESSLGKDSSGTYNTFVDRQMYWKTLNALQKHAHKQGMFGATVRYISSEHLQKEGQQYPIANNFNYIIEWSYGYRQGNVLAQKKRVTAKVEIDASGKIQMPKVFATLDGQEYPFDKTSIKMLERIPSPPSAERRPKMTDTLTFRQNEVSRILHSFNFATASLDGEVLSKREVDGKLHNEAGPAVIHKNGSEEYWVNGELHREDGPAVVGTDGFKAFFVHGQLHNSKGPAVVYPDGRAEVWFHGKYIRPFAAKRDMPKQVSTDQKNLGKVGFDFYNETVPGFSHKETDENGSNYYFDAEDRLHRTDGPAVEHANGQGEYYVNGQKMSPEQYQQYVQKMKSMSSADEIVEGLVKNSFDISSFDEAKDEVKKWIENEGKENFTSFNNLLRWVENNMVDDPKFNNITYSKLVRLVKELSKELGLFR